MTITFPDPWSTPGIRTGPLMAPPRPIIYKHRSCGFTGHRPGCSCELRLRPTPPVSSPPPQQQSIKREGGMGTETRNFLIDIRSYLKGHGHDRAAQEVLDHIDEQDAKERPA